MQAISEHIIGQENAINEISKSLWYLTNVNRSKPYVIMLYGNSSLGKTELVREIANKFLMVNFTKSTYLCLKIITTLIISSEMHQIEKA